MNERFRIRIGNQTACSASHPLDPFEFALRRGFDAFEFFPDRGWNGKMGWHEKNLDASTRQYIKNTSGRLGLSLSVHASLEFNPVRNPRDERLRTTIDFASDIGARLVNIHLDISRGIHGFAEAIRPTLEATADAGLGLVVENTLYTGPEDFNALFKVLKPDFPSPIHHCGMCFDMGHANLFDRTRNDYLKYLDELCDNVPLMHLHLHENHGDRDSHLTLFTGPSSGNRSGLEGMMKRLIEKNYVGNAIMEQWPDPPALLSQARNGLLQLIDEIQPAKAC